MWYFIYAVGVVVAYWALTKNFAWFMRGNGWGEEEIKEDVKKMRLGLIVFSLCSWFTVGAVLFAYAGEKLIG